MQSSQPGQTRLHSVGTTMQVAQTDTAAGTSQRKHTVYRILQVHTGTH